MRKVLILILLEYGLQPAYFYGNKQDLESLNPYSTGIWSATHCYVAHNAEDLLS